MNLIGLIASLKTNQKKKEIWKKKLTAFFLLAQVIRI